MRQQRLESVNEASNKELAPQHAMYELGNVIPRIIWEMAKAPEYGIPLLFTKIDLKDGYWRMVVDEDDAWNFAYVLPKLDDNKETQLVIPDALQMGWSESPPFFCVATETARDIADNYFTADNNLPAHPNEDTIMKIDWNKIPHKVKQDEDVKVLHLLKVYIDDFIGMIQSTDEKKLLNFTRAILKGITRIFPPPDVTGSVMGPPISPKKLEEKGPWEARKEILGWILDGIARTIQLPAEKCKKLIHQLRKVEKKETIATKELESIHGKLQFASIGIPMGKSILGLVDTIVAGANRHNKSKIKVTEVLKDYCRNWRALLYLMQSRPSHVKELVRNPKPAYQGLVDAAGWGVGGVWFSGFKLIPPIVWYFEWPEHIRNNLCTDNNPEGPITISDLELLGIFMHWLTLEKVIGKDKLEKESLAIWCDNISAVAWVHKFRNSKSNVATNILRAFATRIH